MGARHCCPSSQYGMGEGGRKKSRSRSRMSSMAGASGDDDGVYARSEGTENPGADSSDNDDNNTGGANPGVTQEELNAFFNSPPEFEIKWRSEESEIDNNNDSDKGPSEECKGDVGTGAHGNGADGDPRGVHHVEFRTGEGGDRGDGGGEKEEADKCVASTGSGSKSHLISRDSGDKQGVDNPAFVDDAIIYKILGLEKPEVDDDDEATEGAEATVAVVELGTATTDSGSPRTITNPANITIDVADSLEDINLASKLEGSQGQSADGVPEQSGVSGPMTGLTAAVSHASNEQLNNNSNRLTVERLDLQVPRSPGRFKKNPNMHKRQGSWSAPIRSQSPVQMSDTKRSSLEYNDAAEPMAGDMELTWRNHIQLEDTVIRKDAENSSGEALREDLEISYRTRMEFGYKPEDIRSAISSMDEDITRLVEERDAERNNRTTSSGGSSGAVRTSMSVFSLSGDPPVTDSTLVKDIENGEDTPRGPAAHRAQTAPPKEKVARPQPSEDELWAELEMTEQNLLFDVQNFRGQKGASKRVLEGLAKASDLMDRLVVCQWKKKHPEESPSLGGRRVSLNDIQNKELQMALSNADMAYHRSSKLLNNEINKKLSKYRSDDDVDELVRQHLRRQKGLVQRRMAEREKIYSDFQEKLWKHMEEQNKLLRDNVERRKRDSRPLSRPLSSVSKRDSRPISLISNSEEDQLDQERILESYGAILDTMDSEEEDEDEETSGTTMTDSDADSLKLVQEDLPLDDDANVADDTPETFVLKATLTSDIQNHFEAMNSGDFRTMMTMYREERQNLRAMRGAEKGRVEESLWKRMQEQGRNWARRASETDDTKSKSDAATAMTMTSSGGEPPVNGKTDAVTEMGDSMQTSKPRAKTRDAQTGTDSDLTSYRQALDRLTFSHFKDAAANDASFLRLLDSRESELNEDDLQRLFGEHLQRVERLRKTREVEADRCREKLEAKLRARSARRRNSQDPVSETKSQTTNSSEPTESTVKDIEVLIKDMNDNEEEEKDISAGLDDLTEECLNKVADRKDDISITEVREVLEDYRRRQMALMKSKQAMRRDIDSRIQDALSRRKSRDQVHSGSRKGRSNNQMEKEISRMDEEFYAALCERQKDQTIPEAELSGLVAAHLDKVEAFERKLRKMMSRKRKERKERTEEERREREERRRIRQEAKLRNEQDAVTANQLVQQHGDQVSQLRKLRDRERERADAILEERLNRRNADSPDLQSAWL